jgi:hypothetical protein
VGIRVTNLLAAEERTSLERLVRSTLAPLERDLDVWITAALDAAHAEIVIKEDGVWRGGCLAPLRFSPEQLSAKILDSF